MTNERIEALVAGLTDDEAAELLRTVRLIESDKRMEKRYADALADGGDPVVIRHRGCDGIVGRLEGATLQFGWGSADRRIARALADDIPGMSVEMTCRKCGESFPPAEVWRGGMAARRAGRPTTRIAPRSR
jgi:hypothetical protein